jgi:hypothetical protein
MSKEALAERPKGRPVESDYASQVAYTRALEAYCDGLAERPAQQEPVTWGVDWGKAGDIPCVSIIKRLPDGRIEVMAVEYAPYEYNPPAQRTWVGLTDREMVDAIQHLYQGRAIAELAAKVSMDDFRAIEAKLRSKNT